MPSFINEEALRYFFGPLFNVDLAMHTIRNYNGAKQLEYEVGKSIEEERSHTGIQIIGYQNVDTGLCSVALRSDPAALSGVSFFTESKHRLFGGAMLVCVPLAFCTTLYKSEGDYIVYRHTYKKPKFDPAEIKRALSGGSDERNLNTFFWTKSRDAYETIPGMSYVGITSRTWYKRYGEHVEQSLEKSSSTRFHEAIREMQGKQVICIHDISAFGLSKLQAKAVESELITKSSLWPLGLNMKV